MSGRPRRRFVLPAQIVTLVAVVVVVVVAVTTSGRDHAQPAATTTTLGISDPSASLPSGTALNGGPGQGGTESLRIELRSSSDAPAGSEQVSAARALLRRRLKLLIGCETCLRTHHTSFTMTLAAGPGSPPLEELKKVLFDLGETALHPVIATGGTLPCDAGWSPDPDGVCLQLGDAQRLPLTDVRINDETIQQDPDAPLTVRATLGPSGVEARAGLMETCSAGAATCPAKQMALVVGERVVQSEHVGDQPAAPATASVLALGPMDPTDARMIAAAMVNDPALDGWTLEGEPTH